MEKNRKSFILKDKDWIEVPFKEIKNGNKFKLIEYNGEVVKYKNKNIFEATSDAYLNENNIYEIKTKE